MMKTGTVGMLLGTLLFFWPTPSIAEVFQWTDSRGIIHMTDDLHSVPESLRNSPTLIIRRNFDVKRSSPEISYQPAEIVSEEPLVQPKPPEPVSLPEPEPKTAAPPTIHYNPQSVNIVVVNNAVQHSRRHPCPGREGCRGVLRPDFGDRRYIHPSVFDGGSRQYIQPK